MRRRTISIDPANVRKAEVIDNMVEAGYLSKNAAANAKQSPTKLAKSGSPSGGSGYFVDWIETQIPLFIGRVDDGIVVETTLDPLASEALKPPCRRHWRNTAKSVTSAKELSSPSTPAVVFRP